MLDVLPHEHGIGFARGAFPGAGFGQVKGKTRDIVGVGERGEFRAREAFEEGGAREAVGAVQAGAPGFADGVEVADIGAAVEIGVHAAASKMRGGHDGDRLARTIYAVAKAAFVDVGETLADELGLQRGEIEEHARLAAGGQLLLDRAGDDITGRERTAGMHAVHETLALGVDEHAALAAQGLGDEEARGVFLGEDRRVKLDVFEVDEARAHAIRHRDAVAHAAGLVGRVQENLPEAAGGEDGFLGDDGYGLAGGRVEHVGPETGERLVFVGGVGGVVGKREEVDGDPALAARDAWRGVHALRDAVEDGVAGGVLGEDDALLAVAALAGEFEFAGGVAVEGDVEFVE